MKILPKHISILSAAAVLALTAPACSTDVDNATEEATAEWMNANLDFYNQLAAQTEPFAYERVTPVWNRSSEVLMHWYTDRALTSSAPVPLETSTVDIKYRLTLYDGTPVDSSYLLTDSTYRVKVTNLINGFQIALQTMHVGDSVRLIVPYWEGYGATASGSVPAYSTLNFELKLKDIYRYELP